jgi:hypothetical protein
MQKLIDHFSQPYEILVLLLFLLCLFTLPVTILSAVRKKSLLAIKMVPLYVFLIALQLFLATYEILADWAGSNKQSPANISTFIFISCEFIIFSLMLRQEMQSAKLKRILLVGVWIFPVIALIIWTSTSWFYYAITVATSVEAVILVPFCLVYFVQLQRAPPVFRLIDQPMFWMITGILFLLVIITPYYLLLKHFRTIPEMQIVDHAAYMLIVLLFAKASILTLKK